MVQSGLLISFFVIYSSKDTAYECYMDPEPGSQSGPGDSVDADLMAPSLLVTKSSPPRGGLENTAECADTRLGIQAAVSFI